MSSDEDSPKKREKFASERNVDIDQSLIIGPALPAGFLQDATEGPALPPHLKKPDITISSTQKEEGPPVPAHLLPKLDETDVSFGPALPPHLQTNAHIGSQSPPLISKATQENDQEKSYIGPALPPGFSKSAFTDDYENDEEPEAEENDDNDNDEDEEYLGIGPDLALMSTGSQSSSNAKMIEEREERAKQKMLGLNTSAKPKRETWMLELPPEKAANLGLGPRQFRTKNPLEIGDRSVWTDTPEDTEKKQNKPKIKNPADELKRSRLDKRDREMEKAVRKAEKKLDRKKSLLDKHTEKLAKQAKKAKTDEKTERKRFNRETDLQVNRFDDAQKRSIIKKAQLLNNRFSSGESKYL